MSDSRRQPPVDLAIAVLLGGGAFLLYLATLAPTVLAGDPGEFEFVPYLLGVAHPTGYPLYCLLGWAWSHLLPFSDPAWRMNLFSAFWAALAVALLYPTARLLLRQALPALPPGTQRPLAALAAATFAVTPTLWSQAVIAEVYGLHIFFVVLLFHLLLRWSSKQQAAGDQSAARILLLAACCFGLSLTHHATTVLLAPALLAYWQVTSGKVQVSDEPHSKHNLLLATCYLLLAVCLPLLLYLYIPLRAPHTSYLRLPLAPGRELVLYENTLGNLLNFVTGGPFGGSVDLSVNLGERLAMAWGLLRSEVGWIGVLLALVGIGRLAIVRKWALLALTGLAFGATVAFNLVYTIGDIYVLFIPAYLVVVLWLVIGVGVVVQICRFANLRISLALLAFALPVWLGASHYADVDQSGNTAARTGWEAILAKPPVVSRAEPLPANAVLVSDDRNDIMPLWYFQYVDGVRPDLLGLFPLITPEYPTLGPILDLALSTGRSVYLIKEMPGVEVKVEVEAENGLWRVVGPAAGGEPAVRSEAQWADAVRLVGYDLSPLSPQPGETLQISLYWEALRPLKDEYHTFVHLLDPAGQKVAQSDRQPGGVFYPTTLWRPGEILRDDHSLTVPADAPPGTYHLLVGLYTLAADGTLGPLGEPVVAGPVDVR
jgi:hypothetical protein